ncbi:MAG: VirB4 family type IV secretion system protein [Candidatus Dormibacteria bacterium]
MVQPRLRHAARSPLRLTLQRDDEPGLFTTNGVNRHCVLTTGTFDLVEAAPETRHRQVLMFEQLLAGLEGRFQLHVSSRPAGGVASTRARVADFLAAAPGQPTFRRQVALVVSDSQPVAARLAARWSPLRSAARFPMQDPSRTVRAEAESAARTLGLMGLDPQLLEGRALDRFLDQGLPGCISRGVETDWQEAAGVLRIDDVLSRSFVLDAYPGLDLEPGWLSALLETPATYDFALHGFRVPAGSALRVLSSRIRDLQAARLSDLASHAVGDPMVEAGLPEAIGLRREVASNQQHVYSIGVYVTLEATNTYELEAATEALQDRASRSMLRLLPATFEMAPARVATLPVGEDPMGDDRLLPGGVVATLYPWLWDELQQPAGAFIGRRRRGGSPVLLDTWDEARFSNANLGIFGHSGAGKTFLMKGLLLSDHEAGIGGFVIDPEAEYGEVCRAVGGQWVDLALGAGTSINVLDAALSAVAERDPVGDQVSDLLDLLGTMCGALSNDERVDLDLVLRELLGSAGQTLMDLRARLVADGAAPRVARGLRRWTEGPMGDLFARPTNVALDAEFVVFSLRDLKEEVLPVAYFLIAQWIWARVRSAPRRRRLLFDEVGLVFEYPLVRRFLVRLARRVRKYQGSLCLVTQNAGDLLASDQGLVLATNPATLFLGAQRQAEAQRLQRALGLTESQVEFLATAQRGDFLLLAGDRRHRVRVAANPFQLEMAGAVRP